MGCSSGREAMPDGATSKSITCVTWNVAAINNNPFEYWVTHDNAAYLRLMEDVQAFIDKPTGDQDVEVSSVFPDALFEELATAMAAEGWSGVEETRELWRSDFSKRRIISTFLKDKQIGAKRLASMPDRLTNTIDLASGDRACRPTVISNCSRPLPDIPTWWAQWKAFMFEAELELPAKGGGSKRARPCTLLSKIPRAKYPAVTESEEAISVPLQALCCAVFDAILVHMLNTVAPDSWQAVKVALCGALCTNKATLTVKILEEQYAGADVVFLQECAAAFTDALHRSPVLSARFHVLVPAELDTKRDQNSLILASKSRFDVGGIEEVTAETAKRVKDAGGAALAVGDLYAAVVRPAAGSPDATPCLLASFHGDTDGLLTVPVLDAICATREARGEPKLSFIFGLDANAYSMGVAGKKLGAQEFTEACAARGLGECWSGQTATAPLECCTTFNARTYLQPQLNKAVSRGAAGMDPNTDRNPKDYIVFDVKQLAPVGPPERDNTGKRGAFDADAPFPTLNFPSDHAALLSVLTPPPP
uniref:Endonuclease/exonuclease/phosphatase domain-containing protein n=1 Tax=Alexandrium monilatum TaxID=311494 RepID=A0A7S4QTB0_9DINO